MVSVSNAARGSVDSARSRDEEPHRSSFSLKSAAHKVYQAAKDHHSGVNSAFEAYYGIKASPQRTETTQGGARRTVLQAAKDHHRGVNSAFEAYYGIDSYSHSARAQGVVRS